MSDKENTQTELSLPVSLAELMLYAMRFGNLKAAQHLEDCTYRAISSFDPPCDCKQLRVYLQGIFTHTWSPVEELVTKPAYIAKRKIQGLLVRGRLDPGTLAVAASGMISVRSKKRSMPASVTRAYGKTTSKRCSGSTVVLTDTDSSVEQTQPPVEQLEQPCSGDLLARESRIEPSPKLLHEMKKRRVARRLDYEDRLGPIESSD